MVYTIGSADAPYSRARRSSSLSSFTRNPQKKSGVLSAKKRPSSRITRSASSSSDFKQKELYVGLHNRNPKIDAVNSESKIVKPKYSVAKVRNGTNMIPLRLAVDDISQQSSDNNSTSNGAFVIVSISLAFFTILVCIIIVVCIRKRRRKRKKEMSEQQGAYPAKINNLRNNYGREIKFSSPKGQSKNQHTPRLSKCNIIKAKETNILSKQGINVDGGTEV